MLSREIYDLLSDEKSKQIYKLREKYCDTADYAYIRQLVMTTNEAKELENCIRNSGFSKVVIWGTGYCGKMLKKTFSRIDWSAYIDNNPKTDYVDGIPVIKGEKFLENPDALIVIGAIQQHAQIKEQLLCSGIKETQIIDAGQLVIQLEKKQYFDLPELKSCENESFVDVGCFDGKTSMNFIEWSSGNVKKIWALEPDKIAFENCVQNLSQYKFAEIFNCGAWCQNMVLSFDEKGVTSSCISDSGNTKVDVKSIDYIIKDEEVTFIKMDVEGAELKALQGAAKTIKRYKPKLAICVYHNLDDYYEIAKAILSMNSEYKLYFRHYSFRDAETVLYAL